MAGFRGAPGRYQRRLLGEIAVDVTGKSTDTDYDCPPDKTENRHADLHQVCFKNDNSI
ncbi:MAG: hypothetical protein GQF41_1228 [Candidatus Rifleibacterium amylolyticum]|nr:MAG: hypothetical protein GQF41_1228 [Candidatus Rifleibacterium amylolyticum]